ncbi:MULTISPECIES: radical SAM family heme chaperone HemW [unclassified Arthrobacter]|uniref:radical SAM family heme chaperone HemW n=1 Tax=unclassified Arthrobacter TaxID=235627 RepID=UPI001D13BF4E|nr:MULTISPECIES: radical SAM family heme chaperone HemW [unclassified Arthrobacter]MCC3274835.1 radical SAM family heme chaperone HemW [Arthrobacter sp. zg-Y20]MCC9177571.1 radical SAM family heme chaperone HemW [Arthrobacter sp. zg-Y750]MDK1314991.1 radical SAM family heme chaperone HemW [Arthrobacter sp. zg.Y20]WIB04842.1 radical SAM family heme chaperone HemW [Arthrobacter sp. zg-Y20]
MTPSALPLGDPAPADGLLPAQAAEGAAERNFGLYVHIPFCSVRCGYCDFNTYTATELGGGASQAAYGATAAREVVFAADALRRSGMPERRMETVFFGGGTPTLLPAEDLAMILTTAVDQWGLAPGAEVTTEANPDSVTPESLQLLADAGFTRVSFGMQSAVPHVLAVLDRTHTPSRVPQAVKWARDAGLHVSVDLIYGTPGESMEDWKTSVEEALSYEPDHISAYALIIEEGTKLAARMRRGEVPPIDDDDHADKYVLADEMMTAAGLSWYEVSNWARTPADQCRHNLAYWRSDDWWGIGPGAHSHAGGVRWWNAKHPTAYAQRIAAGESPSVGRETLDADTRYIEDIMLRTRLAEGLELNRLREPGRLAVAGLMADGLVDPRAALTGKVILTGNGRLLADAVVRRLLPD